MTQTSEGVKVEMSITQVVDGLEYKGRLNFEGRICDYEITFEVPIPEVEALTEALEKRNELNVERFRHIFQMTARRADGVEIELSDTDFGVLSSLVPAYAFDFHGYGQTRDANDPGGILSEAVKPTGRLRNIGLSVNLGMSKTLTFPSQPSLDAFMSKLA